MPHSVWPRDAIYVPTYENGSIRIFSRPGDATFLRLKDMYNLTILQICIYSCLLACLLVCLCMCKYIYIYIYVYMYIQFSLIYKLYMYKSIYTLIEEAHIEIVQSGTSGCVRTNRQ